MQSLFKKETDPSKLGKALSDTTTRRVLIGVLLMLMVLFENVHLFNCRSETRSAFAMSPLRSPPASAGVSGKTLVISAPCGRLRM